MPVTNVARLLAASIIVFGVFHAAKSLAQELTPRAYWQLTSDNVMLRALMLAG